MRRHLALFAVLVLGVSTGCESLFPACGPGSKCAPVEPDYPTTAPTGAELVGACERAGDNLARLGCPEGQNPKWMTVCIEGTELRRAKGGFPLACWTRAADKVHALSCGSLRCVR